MLIFSPPSNPEVFEHRWSEKFVPAVERMQGIRRISVSRVTDAPHANTRVYLIHELYFDGKQELRSALASSEGQQAGEVLMDIAEEFVTICLAEHLEEDR